MKNLTQIREIILADKSTVYDVLLLKFGIVFYCANLEDALKLAQTIDSIAIGVDHL